MLRYSNITMLWLGRTSRSEMSTNGSGLTNTVTMSERGNGLTIKRTVNA